MVRQPFNFTADKGNRQPNPTLPPPALIITLGLLQGKVDPLVQRPGPGTGFTGPKVFVIQSLFKPVFSCRHKRSTAFGFSEKACVSASPQHVPNQCVVRGGPVIVKSDLKKKRGTPEPDRCGETPEGVVF